MVWFLVGILHCSTSAPLTVTKNWFGNTWKFALIRRVLLMLIVWWPHLSVAVSFCLHPPTPHPPPHHLSVSITPPKPPLSPPLFLTFFLFLLVSQPCWHKHTLTQRCHFLSAFYFLQDRSVLSHSVISLAFLRKRELKFPLEPAFMCIMPPEYFEAG